MVAGWAQSTSVVLFLVCMMSLQSARASWRRNASSWTSQSGYLRQRRAWSNGTLKDISLSGGRPSLADEKIAQFADQGWRESACLCD